MAGKKYTLIVNPHGGNGKGLAILDQVQETFEAVSAELDIHITQAAGDGLRIAKDLSLDTSDGVCVIGGDGTIHEVVNGLMQRSSAPPPLGIIPAGTGNSVHQHFNIANPSEATRRIIKGKTEPLDLARLTVNKETSYAANVIGWGVFVDINQTAERWRFLGSARYTLAALLHIFAHKKRLAKLVLPNHTMEEEILLTAICNTQFTGKGMRLAPHASAQDGKLDIVIVKQATRWQIFTLFRYVFQGSHLSLPFVEHHQVESLSLDHEEKDTLTIDGELKGCTPMKVEVRPSALRIFTR